jgi:hypothetical protein
MRGESYFLLSFFIRLVSIVKHPITVRLVNRLSKVGLIGCLSVYFVLALTSSYTLCVFSTAPLTHYLLLPISYNALNLFAQDFRAREWSSIFYYLQPATDTSITTVSNTELDTM